MKKIYDLYNPNADIFEIEREEGGVEDDNYLASIGDSVARHIQSLNQSQRMCWEDLYCITDGNIFRIIPNWQTKDDDQFNLKGKELDKYFLKLVEAGVSKEVLENIKEAMIAEQERREKSEDIMDQFEAIPYHEWENFPQMWASFDIPTTPKDKYIYIGNNKQQFYDYFPEGHPDSQKINQFLYFVNNENIYDKQYYIFLKNWIDENLPPYLNDMLSLALSEAHIGKIDIKELLKIYLQEIDNSYFQDIKIRQNKLIEKDGMLQLIYKNWSEWEIKHKKGCHVFADILNFGQTLFSNFKNSMNGYHWHIYRKIKNQYAPAVIIGSVDINRCRLSELSNIFNMSRDDAKRIWLARPFRNISEIYDKKLVKKSNFVFSKNGDKIINWIDKQYEASIKKENIAIYFSAGHQLTRMDLENKAELTKIEWKQLWSFYNILKQQLLKERKK